MSLHYSPTIIMLSLLYDILSGFYGPLILGNAFHINIYIYIYWETLAPKKNKYKKRITIFFTSYRGELWIKEILSLIDLLFFSALNLPCNELYMIFFVTLIFLIFYCKWCPFNNFFNNFIFVVRNLNQNFFWGELLLLQCFN